jgi:hypothetical protein
MSNVDTSAEAVDALIHRHRLVASTWRMSVSDHERTAATLRALLAERDGLAQLVDRMHEQDVRAVKEWQAAHPGHDLVWPDQSRLAAWCLGEMANARRERDAMREALDRIRGVAFNTAHFEDADDALSEVEQIARAALEGRRDDR